MFEFFCCLWHFISFRAAEILFELLWPATFDFLSCMALFREHKTQNLHIVHNTQKFWINVGGKERVLHMVWFLEITGCHKCGRSNQLYMLGFDKNSAWVLWSYMTNLICDSDT